MSAIGGIHTVDSNIITFDLENFVPHLPSQVYFLIQVIMMGKNIHRTLFDEDASTCIMYIAFWKAIVSPPLSQTPNTLEAFNYRGS